MIGLAVLFGFCLYGAQVAPPQATKPQAPMRASSQHNPFEPIPEPAESPHTNMSGPTIESIEFGGANRLPQSILRAVIASHIRGAYDLATLRRDSQALYNTGRFSNVAWETEMRPSGAAVRFVVVERPLIQSIEYQGDDTVTIEEIVDRLRERKVNLRVETLYNDNELGRATATVKELLAERGRQQVSITPLVESIWPHSTVRIVFRVAEQ